jgi:hypothetical protein
MDRMSDLTLKQQHQKENVITLAEADHAQYPQYANYWRGSEWRLCRILKDVKTKLGVAFKAEDITIGRLRTPQELDQAPELATTAIVYSQRNRANTAVTLTKLEWLETPEAAAIDLALGTAADLRKPARKEPKPAWAKQAPRAFAWSKETPRARAQKRVIELLEMLEEHITEAERAGNDALVRNLRVFADGLYDVDLPTKAGEVRITLRLGGTL